MHSYPRGEKLENIQRNQKVGFEVDRELEFLPSYFSHPTNASLADTLYISVVIKGTAVFVDDDEEKALGLNEMMRKYQRGIDQYFYEIYRPNTFTEGFCSFQTITEEADYDVYLFNQTQEYMKTTQWCQPYFLQWQ